MIGILPVTDRNGKTVATLSWDGTMWRGKGTWIDYASHQIRTKVENAILAYESLKINRFSDMVGDATRVRGWQGFAGWYQALAIALPAYGLDIDRENITWPHG